MEITSIRHNWTEPAGFSLSRPEGSGDYVLLHFHTPVTLSFGGRHIETRPGAFIVFSPATGHRFVSHSLLLHDWIHISGDLASEMNSFTLQPDTLYQPGCGDKITELIAQLEVEYFAARRHWKRYSQALLTQLFILLSRDNSGETPPPVPLGTADLLRSLRAEMLLHPEYDWTNARMAQRISLSVSRLYPLYRRMFSLSPNQDLILIRVEKAKNMLRQGESVSQTAECLGYSNVYHFIRQFRQIVGITPGQYGRYTFPE